MVSAHIFDLLCSLIASTDVLRYSWLENELVYELFIMYGYNTNQATVSSPEMILSLNLQEI